MLENNTLWEARAMSGYVRIGQAARLTGLSIKAIRYYEAVGLLPPPPRTEARYRIYGEDDVRRLHRLRRAKELGFTLRETGELLNLTDAGCCTTVRPGLRALFDEKMRQIDARIRDLRTLRGALAKYARALPTATEKDSASCRPDLCVPAIGVPITLVIDGASENGRPAASNRGARP
jgi:MerR family copper efflux transcriptional regulator